MSCLRSHWHPSQRHPHRLPRISLQQQSKFAQTFFAKMLSLDKIHLIMRYENMNFCLLALSLC